MKKSKTRIIKKISRRLYDEESKYVTLYDLQLRNKPERIAVIDQKSEEDITRSVLLQIILEQEEKRESHYSQPNYYIS